VASLLVFGPSFWFLAAPAAKSWRRAWVRTGRCARVEGLDQSAIALQGWEAYKAIFHIYRAILESFFYAYYNAIVDISVIISFFLEKHYIPQHYRCLTCYLCARLCQCFGQGGCCFRYDKPCTCNYICTQHFLLLRRCAYLNSLCKFGFQAWIGLQKWKSDPSQVRDRAGFRLQNEALLQLCVGM